MGLLVLLVSFFPARDAVALSTPAAPPVDMFQLPWDLGIAWVAIDGLDNGTKRPLSSSHHYSVGGAVDFAPRSKMVTGENTSNFWVTAAAAGTAFSTRAAQNLYSGIGQPHGMKSGMKAGTTHLGDGKRAPSAPGLEGSPATRCSCTRTSRRINPCASRWAAAPSPSRAW